MAQAFSDHITNAAAITLLPPIDNNYKTGGGELSVGGCLVAASKGKPFAPRAIYGATTDLEDCFGLPLPKKAANMEGLRHLSDAAESCSYVNAARVVDTLTYRFPSLSFLLYADEGKLWEEDVEYAAGDVVAHAAGGKWLCYETHTANIANEPTEPGQTVWLPFIGAAEANAHRFNESVIVGEGAFLTIYPIDGDASINRSVRIKGVNAETKRFTLEIWDKDELNEPYLLESHEAGVDVDDKDDLGLSAYIETVFERDSTRFRVDYMESAPWQAIEPILFANAWTKTRPTEFAFTGGTPGEEPQLDDWLLGVNVFRNDRVACNLLFAAGNYEPDFIVAMAGVADDRHIAFFYDVPPGLKCAEAIAWDQDLGLTSRHARAYYSPYSANDPWRGGKCVWGVSGAMAAAKARCNKIVTAKAVPGVHYAPAGEARSYLTRTGLSQLFPEDAVDRLALYDARINPIESITSGGCGADDDLTHWFKTNYLRFGWVNDVLDYIDHRFVEAARQAKFEPDGLTKMILRDLTEEILKDLVTSGALVNPRDPERDGTNPWVVTIQQLEIDLWKVTWDVCVTGAARRIAGQPRLIR